MGKLPDGLMVFCKKECETCAMVIPVLRHLAQTGAPFAIYSQDDPAYLGDITGLVDDSQLEQSFKLDIEAVPTLIKVAKGREVARAVGWHKIEWRTLTGVEDLGRDLPDFRPGCGAKNVQPEIAEQLALRFGKKVLSARRIETPPAQDEIETCFARGWTDGLPVVPPTEARVLRMLTGTTRKAHETVASVPPNQVAVSVEKVAINAVMAGCKPEYMPVVLAAVEAACTEEFALHGLLATTYFASPVVIVNGPIADAIGMNSGVNALGQGNRANATIGRALQLIVRNVGGGRPGEIDRATMGTPGKYSFCFAEDEKGSPWESLAREQGFEPGVSTVTLFGGGGVSAIYDQRSRTPESLVKTFAEKLKSITHPKIPMAADAVLVVSPEHGKVFGQAGWTKAKLKSELDTLLQLPGKDLVQGAGGITEGIPAIMQNESLPKFRPGGLNIVHAGGTAGRFSAIIEGWVASGPKGSQPVTMEIGT